MRNTDSPNLADLLAISLRWLILFGLALSLGIGGALKTDTGAIDFLLIAILGMPVLWNSFISGLAMFNRHMLWHRQINLVLDGLFVVVLFALTGGLSSSVSWAALLPLFSGALYFGARGALPVALILSLFQAIFTYLSSNQHLQPQAIGMMAGFNLIAGVSVSLLSAPLIGSLRRTYEKTLSQHKENELKAQRQERERMRALFEMIETFNSTLNTHKVLNFALDTAIKAAGEYNVSARKMVGAVLLFDNHSELEIKVSHGFLPQDNHVHLLAEEGIVSYVLRAGTLHLIKDPWKDPELRQIQTLHDCSIAVCLPLIRGITAYGVMLFAHEEPDFMSSERLEVLQMLSNQTVISLQNARLYQDLAREKERIIQTQEEAQKKLSRDLHDGPTQSISAIAMRAHIARRIIEESPLEASQELARIEELARRTTQEIRHMLFTLRPLVLESEGLNAALNTMAEKMCELYQQKVTINSDENAVQRLGASHQSVVFALVEEAVNNASKHAQATEIAVNLNYLPGDESIILLEIVDNGVGFDVKSVLRSYDRSGSMGMLNLQERTDLINGHLKIDSIPGKGTHIRILIPCEEAVKEQLLPQQ